jgi:hypothetical protein
LYSRYSGSVSVVLQKYIDAVNDIPRAQHYFYEEDLPSQTGFRAACGIGHSFQIVFSLGEYIGY